jgi:(2Fe-2S) ferredoxin
MNNRSKRMWVCVDGTHCCQRNPQAVVDALQHEITAQGASDRIEVIGSGCVGRCGNGPNVLVVVGRSRIGYSHVTPADAQEIVAAHEGDDHPVERLRQTRT